MKITDNVFMKINKLYFFLTIFLLSSLTLFCQNENLENSKNTFWQLTYCSDNNINNKLTEKRNFGKVIFKNGKVRQYFSKDTLLIVNFKKIGDDSLIIQFLKLDNLIEKRIFLKSGTYHVKIESRILFLVDQDNIKYQFYKYNTEEIKKSEKRKKHFHDDVNFPRF